MTQIDSDLGAAMDSEMDYRHAVDAVDEGVTLVFDGEYVLADEANEGAAFLVSDHAVDLDEMA